VSKWRWPSWALLVWCIGGPIVIGVLATNSDAGKANDYNEAGRQLSGVTWGWIIGIGVLAMIWRQTRAGRPCRWCGMALSVSTARCTRCGYYEGMPGVATCPNCIGLLDARAPQCPRCGFVPRPGPAPSYPPAPPHA
jgi:hypothetical protein